MEEITEKEARFRIISFPTDDGELFKIQFKWISVKSPKSFHWGEYESHIFYDSEELAINRMKEILTFHSYVPKIMYFK